MKPIDLLRLVPAAVRFLSLEPILEDLGALDLTEIHQVIIGGESGPRRRPCEVKWIQALAGQGRQAGVAVFVKQDAGPRPGMQGRIPDELWAMKEVPQ